MTQRAKRRKAPRLFLRKLRQPFSLSFYTPKRAQRKLEIETEGQIGLDSGATGSQILWCRLPPHPLRSRPALRRSWIPCAFSWKPAATNGCRQYPSTASHHLPVEGVYSSETHLPRACRRRALVALRQILLRCATSAHRWQAHLPVRELPVRELWQALLQLRQKRSPQTNCPLQVCPPHLPVGGLWQALLRRRQKRSPQTNCPAQLCRPQVRWRVRPALWRRCGIRWSVLTGCRLRRNATIWFLPMAIRKRL